MPTPTPIRAPPFSHRSGLSILTPTSLTPISNLNLTITRSTTASPPRALPTLLCHPRVHPSSTMPRTALP